MLRMSQACKFGILFYLILIACGETNQQPISPVGQEAEADTAKISESTSASTMVPQDSPAEAIGPHLVEPPHTNVNPPQAQPAAPQLARAAVVAEIAPNKLGIDGSEFQTIKNPVGEGWFVFDPRTRFHGVERYLVWWVSGDEGVFPLNSPAKMVTPSLKWAREMGVDAPTAHDVIEFVFRGKAMRASQQATPPAESEASFTVEDYRIYHALMSAPMSISEDDALKKIAADHGMPVEEARGRSKSVLKVLSRNDWFGSPESEIRHASDWDGETP